ncbi:MAG: glycosyltransferase family 2 protein [Candidatus Omnitrophica bacterium]|nr:glycosyltransferase family 2 protein [Candidatus Omnitrophota bacterium]
MPAPPCDLILLSWNKLELTRKCLESLFQETDTPAKLIIVDNASEPPVRAFLASVKPRGAIVDVELIQNERNSGYSGGMNAGLKRSGAPLLCLLNNDLVFTQGWLGELIAVAESNPQIGIVNPSSNSVGILPPSGMALPQFGRTLSGLKGIFTEVGMCIGFCMLIKRKVLDAVGFLTEENEGFFFEDEDYSVRAQQAGFQCVVAEGAYVYHDEHKTFRPGRERDILFTRNRKKCNEKWGRRVRIAWPRFQAPPGADELRHWFSKLIYWARRRAFVSTFYPGGHPAGHLTGHKELFRSLGLVPHGDVQWNPIPRRLAPWFAFFRILKRRKKPYDIIVAPSARWGRCMQIFKFIHGADVVQEGDERLLETRWKARRAIAS